MSVRVVVDAAALVSLCRRKGVQMLALDFDNSLISIHTGGMWHEGAQKLAEFVRPCFKRLLSAAMSDNMNVAIVTYSSQQWLIKEVLKQILPRSCNADKIIVRGNTPEFLEKIKFSSMGKEDHIAYVINELYTRHQTIVHPNEVLLLDDDKDNVEIALKFGHKAFEIKDNFTLEDLQKFLKAIPSVPKNN